MIVPPLAAFAIGRSNAGRRRGNSLFLAIPNFSGR